MPRSPDDAADHTRVVHDARGSLIAGLDCVPPNPCPSFHTQPLPPPVSTVSVRRFLFCLYLRSESPPVGELMRCVSLAGPSRSAEGLPGHRGGRRQDFLSSMVGPCCAGHTCGPRLPFRSSETQTQAVSALQRLWGRGNERGSAGIFLIFRVHILPSDTKSHSASQCWVRDRPNAPEWPRKITVGLKNSCHQGRPWSRGGRRFPAKGHTKL